MPLVEAKLHPPSPRPGSVDRAGLVALLVAPSGPPVVSLIAPPGYGKTTVLVQAVARERRPVAWLTLDDLDNDPASLLSYLAAAIDRIVPLDGSIRSAIAASRQRILATAVPRLTSALHQWDRPGVIVLDDVHRLVDRTCLDALSAIIDHLPRGFRIVIAGRSEPGLPFARLRAERDLLEIGPNLLALDDGETGALAAGVGLALTPDEVTALSARTEGWAAGIYLSALAAARGDVEPRPIRSISGRDLYIAAYLRSEFEHDLSDDDVTFLTRTSILETVAPPVAEAVSGLAAAGERLRHLAHANLLIHEVGGATSYRYHNLLRDYLTAELERRESGLIPVLHHRAASWYAASGNTMRAVQHAMASDDVDAAARMVSVAALPTLYGGHASTLDRWLHDLDASAFERYPPLAVIGGWVHLLNGRSDATDRMADIAERSTFEGTPVDGTASFESGRAMLRAIMDRRGPADVLANAALAVSQERPDSRWRANALWLLGSAHLLLGDVDAADAAFTASVDAGATAGATTAAASAKRASIAITRGDWLAAEEHAWRSRATLTAGHYDGIVVSLITYAVAARVAIHRGDLAGARDNLVRAQSVRPLATYVAPWFSVDALLELARAYLAISDTAGAQIVVREAEAIVRRRPDLGTLIADLVQTRQRLSRAATTLAGSSSLTTAELRLLPLLPTYLSFQEIGDRLMISRHTVKTQAMSIYGKLQASSRGEAVERAIQLGLLEPFHGLRLAPRTPAG